MVYYDTTYTNGVIAVREKKLLKDKVFRLCELGAEEGFRMLLDNGFGGGAETATSVHDYEKLIVAEENAIDGFIREYAPTASEKGYLLGVRDFHNAKALLKAAHLGRTAEGMLTSEGLISVDLIADCVKKGDFSGIKELNAYLAAACEEVFAGLQDGLTGAEVGEIFEKAQYEYLFSVAKKKPALKKLLSAKVDMTNILTAFRCTDADVARKKYLSGGNLSAETLDLLFLSDKETGLEVFGKTQYKGFVALCFSAREERKPCTEAEKILGGYEQEYFAERKYELSKNEPFLYYVFRRRQENANVRIAIGCLLAGLSEHETRKRIRL